MESTLLHPPLVHFAIVLPMVALILQLAFSITNNYQYSQWSARTLIVSALLMIATWYTGGAEGSEIYPLLTQSAQEVLIEHKNLGLILMISTIVFAIVKFIACKSRNVYLETLVFIGLLGISSLLAYQGLLGGELVYKHGASVEKHSDGLDCLDDPTMYLDDEEEEDEEE